MSEEASLATRADVERFAADLAGTLHQTRDALRAHLDRGVRRLVLRLSGVMVATAAAVVLVASAASRIG